MLGIRPGAAHLPDLGTINQALAAIAHEIGLRRTPLTEARGPLVRAAHVEDFVTRREDAAIDVPRENRRHIAGDHRRHRFIEQGDTFGDAGHAYQRPPASVTGERGEVAIGKTTGDLGGLAEHVVRPRRIGLAGALDRVWNQEIASHHAVELCLVEQTFRSDEPARGGSERRVAGDRMPARTRIGGAFRSPRLRTRCAPLTASLGVFSSGRPPSRAARIVRASGDYDRPPPAVETRPPTPVARMTPGQLRGDSVTPTSRLPPTYCQTPAIRKPTPSGTRSR